MRLFFNSIISYLYFLKTLFLETIYLYMYSKYNNSSCQLPSLPNAHCPPTSYQTCCHHRFPPAASRRHSLLMFVQFVVYLHAKVIYEIVLFCNSIITIYLIVLLFANLIYLFYCIIHKI